MKDFLGFSLIAAGCLAMLFTLLMGLSGQGDYSAFGGLGLLAAVIGAAIVGER